MQQRTPKPDQLAVALWIRAITMVTANASTKQVEDHVIDLFKLAEPPYRPQIQA